jgi:hypothetical protein
MPEMKIYTGGCHCGAVRYEATADLSNVISCNCSICSKKGSLLTFVPREQFKLLSGADGQADYQFGSKVIHHMFCKTCGIGSYALGVMPDGTKMAAINVRCLDGVDLDALKPTPFDGRSL